MKSREVSKDALKLYFKTIVLIASKLLRLNTVVVGLLGCVKIIIHLAGCFKVVFGPELKGYYFYLHRGVFEWHIVMASF